MVRAPGQWKHLTIVFRMQCSVSDEIPAIPAPFSGVGRLLSSVIHRSRPFFLRKVSLNSTTSGSRTSKVSPIEEPGDHVLTKLLTKSAFVLRATWGSLSRRGLTSFVSMPRVRFWTVLRYYLLAPILFSSFRRYNTRTFATWPRPLSSAYTLKARYLLCVVSFV